MNDEELTELLRRTLNNRASGLRPSRPKTPVPNLQVVNSTSRRRYLAFSLGGVAAAAAVAVGVLLGVSTSQSGHTSVDISGGQPSSGSPANQPSPTTRPAPQKMTTAPGAAAGPHPSAAVPAGFTPLSVTFVSARTGWVLGSLPCPAGTCAALARTTDGGGTWALANAPTIAFPAGLGPEISGRSLVRFANLSDGWIVAPAGLSGTGCCGSDLWSTHDGGRTWARVAVPGPSPTATIEDIEAGAGNVHAVVMNADGSFTIYTSPHSSDQWQPSSVLLVPGGGPTPAASLTLQGRFGWVLTTDRVVTGGARLGAAGVWTGWNPPACSTARGTGVLAAASASDLAAICDEGMWGTPAPPASSKPYPANWLFLSNDGGATFTSAGEMPASSVTTAASPAGVATTIAAGTPAGVLATFDGGKSWQEVYSGAGVSFVGFTTSSQGVAIAGSGLLMTRDGGHSWYQVGF